MSWRVSLPCSKAEAETLPEEVSAFAGIEPPPVLMTSEADPARPETWRLDAYFAAEPDADAVAALRALAPSTAAEPAVEQVEDQDWVTLSQAGLEPIRAGPFFVHTPIHRDAVPAGALAFEIDAGRAFGTGQHETTTGCLIALDRLRASAVRVRNFADVGTGTGLLAFAALGLWPRSRGVASDIDPIAIEVTAENAAINRISLGLGRGQLELAVAPGLRHRRLRARAPYDLIIANILAAPLIDMAPALADALAPGGRLILAGLLDSQAGAVLAAYRRRGLRLSFSTTRGAWPTMVLRKHRVTGGPIPSAA